MPPKRIQVQPARRAPRSQGYLGGAYDALTSEENRSVVISTSMFVVCYACLSSLDRSFASLSFYHDDDSD
jgi:hypothetical protein